jgi:hypothetical protein
VTISAADFSAWLAREGAPRVVLCEMKFAIEVAGAASEGTLYLSTKPYTTGQSESPANQSYRSIVRQLPSAETSVDPGSLGGSTAIAVSSLQLDNADGAADFILDLVIDGRDVAFYLGDPSWARADFRQIMAFVAEAASGSGDEKIEVSLRDRRLLLDKAIAGDLVGDATNTDRRRKPLVFCFGAGNALARNVELVEKDVSTLTYYVLQNYVNAYLDRVYDKGLSLSDGNSGGFFFKDNTQLTANAGTDTLQYLAGHGLSADDVVGITTTGTIFAGLTANRDYWVIAAGLTASDFRLSNTKGGSAVDITGTTFSGLTSFVRRRVFTSNLTVDGTVQLSSPKAGILTADVAGLSPSQSTSTVSGGPGELMRALLVDYGGIPATSIDATSFQTVGDAFGYIGEKNLQATSRVVVDRENLLDVLDDIAGVMQIYWGPDYQGVFRAFRLNLSNLANELATRTLSAADVLRAPAIANARVIVGELQINSEKNVRSMAYGDLVAAVIAAGSGPGFTAPFRWVGRTVLSGLTYAANWASYHKTAALKTLEGAFRQENLDLRDVGVELLGDQKPHIKTLDVITDLRAYEYKLGETVQLTYPRYGFANGRNCKVIGIAPDFVAETVDLTLITRVTPDVVTGSYY